jgi:hypothetical protein
MKISKTILLSLCLTSALAQRDVRTYYDPQKTKPQEVYFTKRGQREICWRYQIYENGNLMMDGTLDDVKCPFTEYHEN